MRVFLTSQPQPLPLPLPPPVQERSDDEALAVETSSRLLLAIQDVVDVKDQMLEEMERIEEMMPSQQELTRLTLSDMLDLLGVAVPPDVQRLRRQGRNAEYADSVLAEANRLWRRTASLLHPDKAKAEPFWFQHDRLARLEAAFKLWGNLHASVQARLYSFMTETVSDPYLFYYLDDDLDDDSFVMCASLNWGAPSSDLDTYIRFDDKGCKMELEVPYGTNSVTFAESSQPNMFLESFSGFRLTYVHGHGNPTPLTETNNMFHDFCKESLRKFPNKEYEASTRVSRASRWRSGRRCLPRQGPSSGRR